ncbi:MAG: ribonuclease R [Bacteroidota bacterium]|nr:ribonuclease R [Bacteroidota bacterium]
MKGRKRKGKPGRAQRQGKADKHAPKGVESTVKAYITKHPGVKIKQLVAHCIKRFHHEKVMHALENLERKGKIEINDYGKIYIKQSKRERVASGELIEGIIEVTASGNGYVIVDNLDSDIFIPSRAKNNALNKDKVLVQITKFGRRPEGMVKEVVKRSRNSFIGQVEASPDQGFAFILPLDNKVDFDIYVPKKLLNKAKQGDTVLVEVTSWGDGDRGPSGIIKKIMTDLEASDLEMQNILINQGFNLEFGSDVDAEVAKIPDSIHPDEIASRKDIRSILTFTIDPDDAKDFDDALSYERLEGGEERIGVHIADVSHFVKPGTALDDEAAFRATSVYLPDRVCPMLPERLSNDLCSLKPKVDRLAFSVYFDINPKGKIEHIEIARSVINSDCRFTYSEAQECIEGRGNEDFIVVIQRLNQLAEQYRKERFNGGSIDFDLPEVRFKLDEKGHPIDVYVKERKAAHMLIEEYMLLANTTVSKYVSRLQEGKKPRDMVYRIHDEPSMEKLAKLSSVAARFGHRLKFEDGVQAKEVLNRFMTKIQGKPEQKILQQLAVRSMSKAEYSPENIGHYGLGFGHYSHFTSPIRRYPDVLAHRIIWECIQETTPSLERDELKELCKQSSLMERKAIEAEREATKFKQCEYLHDRLGEEFEGMISGMLSKGFFVELKDNQCEGFVDLDHFDEHFMFDEEYLVLAGMRSRIKFRMGDHVRVRVARVSLAERKIDFSYIDRNADDATE